MKVTQITYAMLRKTAVYENDRAEVTIALQGKDTVGDAVREAKRVCAAMLASGKATTVYQTATYETVYASYIKAGL